MQPLSVNDFPRLDFGDKRRGQRLVTMINNISSQPGSSIPRQNKTWYDTKATYEFYGNEEITVEMLKDTLAAYGAAHLGTDTQKIFVAHDISIISYNNLSAQDLGHTGNKKGKGILCYSSLAINDQGTPLALVYQHTWIRTQMDKAKQRKQLPFEQKQSYNWHQGVSKVNESVAKELHKIHLADREADIFDFVALSRGPDTDLLIRATHNRGLVEGGLLWNHVAQQPCAGVVKLDIPDAKGRDTQRVEAEVRFTKVTIKRPKTSQCIHKEVEMMAIDVVQTSKKLSGQKELIHWKLLTTLEVNSVVEAVQCVKWYCYRWLIERFHFVLKSGVGIEKLKFEEAENLQKAVHVYSIAAIRVMQLVYQSRATPEVSCEMVLTKEQWVTLYMLIHKNSRVPAQPPTLQQAVRWIGRLGGHLGRKQDGHPGLKTVWLGYQSLCEATKLYVIINHPSPH
jgi:hypothetical protein